LYPDDLLAATRTWWEQIRSGQRTFSFKGQGVEYRFKPDGTWDTIRIANPADDDPKVPEPSPSTIRVEKHLAPVSQAGYQEAGTLRYLFGSLAALLALAGAWFGLRRLKAHT
jgi:hypothetical protein